MAIIKTADNGDKELWIDGRFQASWSTFEIDPSIKGRIEKMIECAVEYGEAKKQKEIQKALGLRL